MKIFWILSITSLCIIIFCMIMNNILFSALDSVIHQLKNKIKPQLLLLNEPNKARFISTDELPLLDIWKNNSMNYGVINIIGMLCAIIQIFFISVDHILPLLVAVLNAVFLCANLVYFPSAAYRYYRVAKIIFNYRSLVKLLAIVDNEKNKPEPVDPQI